MADPEVIDAPQWSAKPGKARKVGALSVVGGGGALAAKPRRIRLSNLRHVADELARVYRGMRSGEIEPADGSRFAFTLSTLAKVIESAEFEGRIAALEREQK